MINSVTRALNWSIHTYQLHSDMFMDYARRNRKVLERSSAKELTHMEERKFKDTLQWECLIGLLEDKSEVLTFEIFMFIVLSFFYISLANPVVFALVFFILGNAIFNYFLLFHTEKLWLVYKTKLVWFCGKRTIAIFLEAGYIK